MNPEDKIIVQEIQKGNIKVFEKLFCLYYPQLVRFAEGILFDAHLSQDVVQIFFIHLWENAERMDIASSIKGYFFQSIRNRCLNRIKSLQIQDRNNLLYIEGMINSNYLDSEDPEDGEKLINTLNLLPEKMKEIFKMKHLENMKQKEISKILNISENTVKTQLSRAKKNLKGKARI